MTIQAVLLVRSGALSVRADVDPLDTWHAAVRILTPERRGAGGHGAAGRRAAVVARVDRHGGLKRHNRATDALVAHETHLGVIGALQVHHDALEPTVAHDPAAVPV
jgi:hypothetical protein